MAQYHCSSTNASWTMDHERQLIEMRDEEGARIQGHRVESDWPMHGGNGTRKVQLGKVKIHHSCDYAQRPICLLVFQVPLKGRQDSQSKVKTIPKVCLPLRGTILWSSNPTFFLVFPPFTQRRGCESGYKDTQMLIEGAENMLTTRPCVLPTKCISPFAPYIGSTHNKEHKKG